MSSRRDWDYLEDMRVAIERIQRYLAALSREQFEQDEKTNVWKIVTDELPPLLPLLNEIQKTLAPRDQ